MYIGRLAECALPFAFGGTELIGLPKSSNNQLFMNTSHALWLVMFVATLSRIIHPVASRSPNCSKLSLFGWPIRIILSDLASMPISSINAPIDVQRAFAITTISAFAACPSMQSALSQQVTFSGKNLSASYSTANSKPLLIFWSRWI